MVLSHNISAMNANRQYGIVTTNKAKSTEKLSSGYKINRAADDAAGLSISEKMRKQIRGLSRGVENTQDGVSLCQVADGALAEVQDMLHRITELSVKAANGTNSESDRQAIQKEINQILSEVDRIGDTTKFNELYVFKGDNDYIWTLQNADGTNATEGDIPFTDFKLADVSIGMDPFGNSADANHLALAAKVNNPNSLFNGRTYNLIYGSGNTSNSSFRLIYNVQDGSGGNTEKKEIVDFNSLTFLGTSETAEGTKERLYNYTNADGINLSIKQTIGTNEGDEEKKYEINYKFTNNSSIETSIDFMFHADTAYNNNDRCEAYFINSTRIDNNSIYAKNSNSLTNGIQSNYIHEDTDVPNSFSIVDVDNALAFTEKISFSGTGKPYAISVGHYANVCDWDYYAKDNVTSNLGGSTNKEDLGFSLFFNGNTGGSSAKEVDFSFDYGIVATDKDNNISGVQINKDKRVITDVIHRDTKNVWIQSGADVWDGMNVGTYKMNSEVLGIKDLSVSTENKATKAIDQVGKALLKVSEHRSKLGAQQNRLEHTILNEDNVVENTTAAESRIRDTDMASEMVKYTKESMLQQVTESIMAQANQSTQGVLSLLQ